MQKPKLNLDDYIGKLASKDESKPNKFGIKCKRCGINFWVSEKHITRFDKCVVCRY